MVELIVIIAVAVVLLGTAAWFVVGRRGDASVLEPPPVERRPVVAPPVRPPTEVEPAEPQVVEEDLEAIEEELDLEELFEEAEAEPEVVTRPSFRDRLVKARNALSGSLRSVLSRSVDQDTWDELEEALILADVGVGTATQVLDHVREQAREQKITDPETVVELVKADLVGRLSGFDRGLHLAETAPSVWLFVGVNGVGKTTTIGKLGRREVRDGRKVVFAAGDTFRAAAAEQLTMWAERADAGIVRGNEGGDPSAVIFDAVEHAAAAKADLVLADTAGRLHTKTNLMEELRKVRRVAEKGAGTVSEVLLVIDATTGQNGLTQARQFTEAVEVTGVVLTKLDGSAKGGIVLAIQQDLGIPVKLVGLGEGPDDLVEFDPEEFVEALFA
jgi:fused signal recognition particle receptor